MGKSIHGMRARSRDRARAHHNGRVSSRLFLTGCSPAEPASASPADATLRLHPPQCQRNFIERYFVTVLVVSAQGSTANRLDTAAIFRCLDYHLDLLQRVEDFSVQAFIPQLSIEALAVPVLPGTPGLDVQGLRPQPG